MKGRTAVITGAGRGVGAAVVQRLSEAGATVLLASRTAAQVDEVASLIRGRGHIAHTDTCDVSDPASVERLVVRAAACLGTVDILVNNAGVALAASVAKTSLDDWNRMMAVNATGAFLCMKAFLPGMIDRRWGRVVNVASVAGLRGDKYIAAYAASKHALIGLTTCAAAETTTYGVTVNAVCPGILTLT